MRTRSVVKSAALPLGLMALLAACSGGGDSAGGTKATTTTLYTAFVDPNATTTIAVLTQPSPPVANTAPVPSTVAGGQAAPGVNAQPGQTVQTATGTVQASGVFYVVQSGDSLRAIAKKFGTTSDALLQLNGLANADLLQIGQRIQLPSSSVGGAVAAGVEISSLYVIEAGDTIGKIAKKFGVSKDALIAANPSIDPNVIRIGAKLAIPAGGKAKPAVAATTVAAAAPATTVAPAPAPVETVAPAPAA
jgi:LysM repeat protein